jgi:hypothetical protein
LLAIWFHAYKKRNKSIDALALFADRKIHDVEISATLYAAWNDFLIDGAEPTDAQIIDEVLERWHEKKSDSHSRNCKKASIGCAPVRSCRKAKVNEPFSKRR